MEGYSEPKGEKELEEMKRGRMLSLKVCGRQRSKEVQTVSRRRSCAV